MQKSKVLLFVFLGVIGIIILYIYVIDPFVIKYQCSKVKPKYLMTFDKCYASCVKSRGDLASLNCEFK